MLIGVIVLGLAILAATILGFLPPSVGVIALFVFTFMALNVFEKGRPD